MIICVVPGASRLARRIFPALHPVLPRLQAERERVLFGAQSLGGSQVVFLRTDIRIVFRIVPVAEMQVIRAQHCQFRRFE